MIFRHTFLGGKIENGKYQCPNSTVLIGYECKPCIGGTIIFGGCKCPQWKSLVGNNYKLFEIKNFHKGYNNSTNNIFKGVLVDNEGHIPHMVGKPVIYLYPQETMDISVQLNIKNSKFTAIYPRFNEKNTWN